MKDLHKGAREEAALPRKRSARSVSSEAQGKKKKKKKGGGLHLEVALGKKTPRGRRKAGRVKSLLSRIGKVSVSERGHDNFRKGRLLPFTPTRGERGASVVVKKSRRRPSKPGLSVRKEGKSGDRLKPTRGRREIEAAEISRKKCPAPARPGIDRGCAIGARSTGQRGWGNLHYWTQLRYKMSRPLSLLRGQATSTSSSGILRMQKRKNHVTFVTGDAEKEPKFDTRKATLREGRKGEI